jgi:hypothetical protein
VPGCARGYGQERLFRSILAARIDVLALDGAFDLGLSAVLDAFETANELSSSTRCLPQIR